MVYHSLLQFSSVHFSRAVVSDSLGPHESQHARPPCPSPTPGAHSDSRPSSSRCQPAISSSVIPFCSGLQSCPASGSFPSFLTQSTFFFGLSSNLLFQLYVLFSQTSPRLMSVELVIPSNRLIFCCPLKGSLKGWLSSDE